MYALPELTMIVNQLNLSMPVAVCAWCKPRERGDGVGQLSHGICPWHLRKIKFQLQGVELRKRQRRSVAQRHSDDEAQLPF